MSKTEKLISRGSEKPEVARAAKTISDMLCRLALGQAQYFAESVEGAFPGLSEVEAAALARCLERTAEYFRQKANGEQFPQCGYHHDPVRPWKTNEEFFYDIHRVFCVLACSLEYCEENQDCWETRSAYCQDYRAIAKMTEPEKFLSSPIRYLLARQIDRTDWTIVVNPNWDTQSTEQRAWTMLLENSFNSYIEYENSGIVYRIVRNLEGYNLLEESSDEDLSQIDLEAWNAYQESIKQVS